VNWQAKKRSPPCSSASAYERPLYATCSASAGRVFDYITHDNPRAAHAVQAKIRASIENLASFPFAGRATDKLGVRALTITRYPYRVFYTVHGDDVVILRILHAARDR
jgi:toxin ParE1/3/4